jgi:hypothetical protein
MRPLNAGPAVPRRASVVVRDMTPVRPMDRKSMSLKGERNPERVYDPVMHSS